jgi:hypothetical protein
LKPSMSESGVAGRRDFDANRHVLVAVFGPLLLLAACASARSEKTNLQDGSQGNAGTGKLSAQDSGNKHDASGPGNGAVTGPNMIDGVKPDSIACRPDSADCSVIGNRVAPLPSTVCPLERPEPGASCSRDGLSCSYGSSLTARCRTLFDCSKGKWQRTGGPAIDAQCEQQADGFCPGQHPKDGVKCVVGEVHASVSCDYPPAVSCYCAAGPSFPGAAGNWECYAAPRNGNCPEVLPNLGDGCSTPGLQCRYGFTGGCYASPFGTVFCYQGSWERGTEPGCSE